MKEFQAKNHSPESSLATTEKDGAEKWYKNVRRQLDRIRKWASSKNAPEEDRAVAEYVEDGANDSHTSIEEMTNVAGVGIAEVAEPGDQPKTAKSLSELLDSNDKDEVAAAEEALRQAEQAGADIEEVVRELDIVRLEYLRDIAKLCIWDDEQNKPIIDTKAVESRKKSMGLRAALEANELVFNPQKCEDDEEVVDAINSSFFDNTEELRNVESRIANLKTKLSLADTDSQRQRMKKALAAIERRRRILQEEDGKIDAAKARTRVEEILKARAWAKVEDEALRAPEELERAASERIVADRYPWTMPGAEKVDPESMKNMQNYYRTLVGHKWGESGDNVRIAGLAYSSNDIDFLEHNGVVPVSEYKHNVFNREDLRRAGIFFINTVGEGEQSIFSEVITDAKGRFDPGEKTFLTKEEFERVYQYQQETGYGIGDLDPDDVVMDMIAADQVRSTRKYNLISEERINKYGDTSSLFVDNGGHTLPEKFGGFFEIDGKRYRLTSVQADLINGHSNYPGVSEMYYPDLVAWDQRYMTASQYVKQIYSPLPTPKEAFNSIKNGISTQRERDWLGAPLHILN